MVREDLLTLVLVTDFGMMLLMFVDRGSTACSRRITLWNSIRA